MLRAKSLLHDMARYGHGRVHALGGGHVAHGTRPRPENDKQRAQPCMLRARSLLHDMEGHGHRRVNGLGGDPRRPRHTTETRTQRK